MRWEVPKQRRRLACLPRGWKPACFRGLIDGTHIAHRMLSIRRWDGWDSSALASRSAIDDPLDRCWLGGRVLTGSSSGLVGLEGKALSGLCCTDPTGASTTAWAAVLWTCPAQVRVPCQSGLAGGTALLAATLARRAPARSTTMESPAGCS